jgi:uncharacterized protein (TIGR02996 family)
VFDHPDDDATRLVYADALIERGDPFGEFLQLEVSVTDSDDPRWDEARKRCRGLLRKHEKEWLKTVRPFLAGWEYDRGFLTNINCDAGKFVKGAKALVEISPNLEVELTKLSPKMLPALARCPLGRLRCLTLTGFELGDEAVAELLRSPTLAGLRELDLGGNDLGLAAARALATSPCAPSLVKLDVGGNPLGPEGAGAILDASRFRSLRELDLWDAGATVEAVANVAPVRFPALAWLYLGRNGLTEGDAKRIRDRFPASFELHV